VPQQLRHLDRREPEGERAACERVPEIMRANNLLTFGHEAGTFGGPVDRTENVPAGDGLPRGRREDPRIRLDAISFCEPGSAFEEPVITEEKYRRFVVAQTDAEQTEDSAASVSTLPKSFTATRQERSEREREPLCRLSRGYGLTRGALVGPRLPLNKASLKA
jgi:hypothetical protein